MCLTVDNVTPIIGYTLRRTTRSDQANTLIRSPYVCDGLNKSVLPVDGSLSVNRLGNKTDGSVNSSEHSPVARLSVFDVSMAVYWCPSCRLLHAVTVGI